jgi:hypothetical protein
MTMGGAGVHQKMIDNGRPGKSVRSSSDLGSEFGNVPQFYFQNVFNTLNILNKNVPKEAK